MMCSVLLIPTLLVAGVNDPTPEQLMARGRFAEALPKTRSGKIMRRLLKQVAAGTEIRGDTTTLEDFGVLAKLGSAEE